MCTGKHYVYLDNIAASVQLHRDTAQKLYMAPSLAFTPLQTSMQDYCSNFHAQVPHTHAHTHPFNVSFSLSGTTRWASTRKVKPIWILLKLETVSGSGISWAICKSAPRSRQITMPAPHHSVFYRQMPFLPPNQQRHSTEGIPYTVTICEEFWHLWKTMNAVRVALCSSWIILLKQNILDCFTSSFTTTA